MKFTVILSPEAAGAKPADLPVEQADRLQLVINRASRES